MPSSGVQTCALDRKSTRLNSSHTIISYAVFCLKKKMDKPALVHSCGFRPMPAVGITRRQQRARRVAMAPAHVRGQLCAPAVSFVSFFFLMIGGPPRSTLFPYAPLFR